MLDICNELHISKKTFYQLFASKEDLVDGLLNGEDHSEKLVASLNNYSGNVIEYVYGSVSKVQKVLDNKSTMNLIYDIEKYYPGVSARHNEKKQKEVGFFVHAIIAKGLSQGLFRTDLNANFVGAMFTLLTPSAFEKIGKGKMCTPYNMVDMFLRILLNAEGLKYYEQLLVDKNKTEK